ncbi:MAG TPA: 2-phosphosulfolactate phosphatase [Ktedonobacteraceae bacterium]|nr:2-phosphosulfolactate phosphatase [Ktedonobacteraceae bacterium]
MHTQTSYRCHIDWGRRGAQQAAARGDVLVIVDTLRFSTATVTALHHGGFIYPCPMDTDMHAFAERIGGVAATRNWQVPPGSFSLSPLTYLHIQPGTRVVLASPNGATCCQYGPEVPYLFVGTLINAQAVAAAVTQILDAEPLNVTVLACGERWHTSSEDGPLRMAIEDYLGAGAILAHLGYKKSAEAQVCEGAFLHAQTNLAELLWGCDSGQELYQKGVEEDVRFAAQLNLYATVPVMQGEFLTRFVANA